MTLADLLHGVPVAQLDGPTNLPVLHLAYDSRRVQPGTVFCTWAGTLHDGHRFIPDALQRGAPAIVAETPCPTPGATRVLVPSGRRALARMAANLYRHPSRHLKVLGVTGTNGKTSVAWITRQLLQTLGTPTGLLGTVAYDLGQGPQPASHTTPEGLDLQAALATMRDHGCQAAAIEVSSHALAQGRTDATHFHAAAFTNLTQDHLDFHRTMEAYFHAKSLLFTSLAPGAIAPINIDCPYGRHLFTLLPDGVLPIACGTAPDADLRIDNLHTTAAGSTFTLHAHGTAHPCHTRLLGHFNANNITLALALASSLGHPLSRLTSLLPSVQPVPGRLETVPSSAPFTVVIDYAHTPDAVTQTLRVLRPLASGQLLAILGCGGDRDRSKRPLMARAALDLAHRCIFTSDNPRSEDPLAIL
ncbi:MAG: UDP-N-acetylmuramoyl-L-alanyl-D-glutamate--2,6-diaminopimelate ligase, partial [Verrucomicrobiia bacterium]